MIGARERQLRDGLAQLDLLRVELEIPDQRLRVACTGLGGPGTGSTRTVIDTLAEQLAERGLALDATLPFDARALAPRRAARASRWPLRARAASTPGRLDDFSTCCSCPPRPRRPRERKLLLPLAGSFEPARRGGDASVADVLIEPEARIRARVENALAAEEINLNSEQGRARAQELIDEALRYDEAEALSGQAPSSLPGARPDRRGLRNDLVGLGAIAERMLADPLRAGVDDRTARRASSATRASGSSASPTSSSKDDRQVRAFLERLLEQVEGKRLDRITPRVEARLPDGSRLTAAIPPVSSNGHHDLHDPPLPPRRRHARRARRVSAFLSEQAAAFLTACVRAGKNIVVCGRVSSGKTTLLNALGRAFPATSGWSSASPRPSSSCRACSRTASATRRAPRALDGLPAVTLEDLVSDALRMNPDRIIVGECRGAETMAMLWAFATGHAGMTSVHGESATTRCETSPASPSPPARGSRPSRRSTGCARSISSSIAIGRGPSSRANGVRRRADRRDRRGAGRRREPAHPEPAIRRRGLPAGLARGGTALSRRARSRQASRCRSDGRRLVHRPARRSRGDRLR